MNRWTGWLLAGVAALSVTAAQAQDAPKKEKLTLRAQRAGWMLGMYMGEERGQPYPFVVEVDPKSEARVKGIRPGDELIRFQDEETRDSLPRIFEMANKLRPGRPVTLWVRRGVQTIRYDIRVPKEQGAPDPEKAAKEDAKKDKDKKNTAKEGEEGTDDKKKTKKRPPVVVKPIPAEE